MIKNNVFRGILYTFLTAMTILAGITVIESLGGSIELSFAELYGAIGYKGILIIAGFIFMGVNLFVFAINNYKKFIYENVGKIKPETRAKNIFKHVYKTVIAALFVAGMIYALVKIDVINLVIYGDVKTVTLTVLTLIASVLLLAFEFGELIYAIRMGRKPKQRKNKEVNKIVEIKKETNTQEQPVFKFGNKKK